MTRDEFFDTRSEIGKICASVSEIIKRRGFMLKSRTSKIKKTRENDRGRTWKVGTTRQ